MRVSFSSNKQYVLVIHESAAEYKFLHSFPAFIRIGGYFCLPAKIPVVNNVVRRLEIVRKNLVIDRDVYEFMIQDFKLLPLPESFHYVTKPKIYQEIALRFLFTVKSGGLLLDPGMGKSKVLLDYAALIKAKLLVVCPKALLFVWEDELLKHRPDLGEYYTIQSTDWKLEADRVEKAQVVFVNYNKAVSLRRELEQSRFTLIHLDEALIKDPSTDRTKELTKLAQSIPYKCLGSGTLVNNSVQDIFCPTRFLEPSLVGSNVKFFNDRYLVKIAFTSEGSDGASVKGKRVVGSRYHNEARSILQSACIVMTKEEWLPLPSKKFIPITTPLSEDQKAAYYDLMRNYICNLEGDFVEVNNALVLMSKLYQISNGFCYVSDSTEEVSDLLGGIAKFSWENIEKEALPSTANTLSSNNKNMVKKRKPVRRKTYFFKEQPKASALINLMNTRIKNRRVIVWYNMEAEFEIITNALKDANISFIFVKGKDKDIGGKIRQFNSDNQVQVLLCQAKSVNYGITVLGYKTDCQRLDDREMQVVPEFDTQVYTHVFYSRNFSLEVFLQQQDRSHRIGQEHDCEYYLLSANSPVEEKLNAALEDKMNIRKDILIDVAKDILLQQSEDMLV